MVGTDDGLVHITSDGGSSWNKIDNIAGAPNQSYVNSVYTSHTTKILSMLPLTTINMVISSHMSS